MKPNAEQLQAIQAPLDKAVRVLAGPGSGKTFVLAHRYAYLLEHSVKPEDILAVTFSKNMADELLERIARVLPSVIGTAAEQQVCTIHACCYRMLRAEGDKRQVVKEWQIKRSLQEIAEGIWYGEVPGYKEILYWIDKAKAKGLDDRSDSDFFESRLGSREGQNLDLARKQFDQDIKRQRLLTFPDMLLEVELRLRNDRAFRERWQTKFKHVIIDEAQDVGAQALRILVTLSFDYPRNPIYNGDDQHRGECKCQRDIISERRQLEYAQSVG